MKFHDVKSYFLDIEHIVLNLKTELDLTRNLLYRTWLKHQQDCKMMDEGTVIPDDIEFISKKSVLLVQESSGSNYEKIVTQLHLLGFHIVHERQEMKVKLNTPMTVYNHIKPYLLNQPYESFYIILLNSSNRLIKTVRVSEGGISGTVVDLKRIFKIALDHYATGIILSHNHPSGNLRPSSSDEVLTKRIIEAGELLDIKIIDHLIIGGDGYYSFSDDGIMG